MCTMLTILLGGFLGCAFAHIISPAPQQKSAGEIEGERYFRDYGFEQDQDGD